MNGRTEAARLSNTTERTDQYTRTQLGELKTKILKVECETIKCGRLEFSGSPGTKVLLDGVELKGVRDIMVSSKLGEVMVATMDLVVDERFKL